MLELKMDLKGEWIDELKKSQLLLGYVEVITIQHLRMSGTSRKEDMVHSFPWLLDILSCPLG
jgi:hypothetical protein